MFSEESPVTSYEVSEALLPLVPVAMFQSVWVLSVPGSTLVSSGVFHESAAWLGS